MADHELLAITLLVAIAPLTGSFLGTVVLRTPIGQSVVYPRSACDHCGHVLSFWDLVPLVSWMVSRGRCRYCGARVSAFYPLIELAALGVAVWALTATAGWQLWATAALGWALLALALINARHFVLPDGLTLPLVPAGLAAAWFAAPEKIADHAIGAVAGFAVAALVAVLARRLGGHPAPRMGDAKLLAASGAWVSWTGLPGVVAAAALAALAAALVGSASGRRPFSEGRVAAGAWVCLGTWLVWLYGPKIIG